MDANVTYQQAAPLTGLRPLAGLIPGWHADAACAGEEENLFVPDAPGYSPNHPHHPESASWLFAVAAVPGLHRPSRVPASGVRSTGLQAWTGRPVRDCVAHGRTWGGSTTEDRVRLRSMSLEDAIQELERTLLTRIQYRIDAWRAGVARRTENPYGRVDHRDRRVAAILGDQLPAPKTGNQRLKLFTAGGRRGPGGHRSAEP